VDYERRRITSARGLLLLGLLAASCGDGSTPAGPSVERVSGVWMAHATLTSVSGGGCVGSALQSSIGSRDIFAALVQQSNTSLTASLNSQGNQTSCSYNGTLAGTSVSLSLTSCQAARVVRLQCADGTRYDVQLIADRITAQASSAGPGTSTSTWNVLTPGSSVPAAVLTLSAEFRWNMLGIPHNDFHVFDGSILPGYVDGVVVIPEEVNPFCEKCGWFWRATP
jgi:hypothetical protein